MYIAMYKPDEYGRKILSGWDIYRTQTKSSPVPNKVGYFYSGIISEKNPMPDGKFEVTDVGILPIEYEETDDVLSSFKNDRIRLINKRFESITEGVAPAGYLIYLYTASLFHDIDVRSIFNWLKILNEERVSLIEQVYRAENMFELLSVSEDLGEMAFRFPELPVYDLKDDDFTFNRTATSTYENEISIPPDTEIKIPYQRNKMPINATLALNKNFIYNDILSNHNERLIEIIPEFCYYEFNDISSSANNLLTSWDELGPDKKHLIVTIPSLVKPSLLSLYLDKGEQISVYVNSELILSDSQNMKKVGNVYKFEIELNYGVSKLEIDFGDNTKCGYLKIMGNEISNISIDREVILPEGTLSINSGDNLKYDITDMEDGIIYSGICDGEIYNIDLLTESKLKVHFNKSDNMTSLYISHEPTKKEIRMVPLNIGINSDRDMILLSHDEQETITGVLNLIHCIPV